MLALTPYAACAHRLNPVLLILHTTLGLSTMGMGCARASTAGQSGRASFKPYVLHAACAGSGAWASCMCCPGLILCTACSAGSGAHVHSEPQGWCVLHTACALDPVPGVLHRKSFLIRSQTCPVSRLARLDEFDIPGLHGGILFSSLVQCCCFAVSCHGETAPASGSGKIGVTQSPQGCVWVSAMLWSPASLQVKVLSFGSAGAIPA